MTPPWVHTTAFGLLIYVGSPEHNPLRWVSALGAYGEPPPVMPHLSVIDRWHADPVWYQAGTIEPVPYVTLLRLEPESCQYVEVRFAGDVLSPHSRWVCWRPGDADGDGSLNSNDIVEFLRLWAAHVGGGLGPGDFNVDGSVDSADITAFLDAWLEGLR